MTLTLATAVSRYGADAKGKLANPSASGEPEDQLRAPLETLFADLTELCGMPRDAFAAVGESAITRSEEHTSELQSRVDLVCRLLLEKKKLASWTRKYHALG